MVLWAFQLFKNNLNYRTSAGFACGGSAFCVFSREVTEILKGQSFKTIRSHSCAYWGRRIFSDNNFLLRKMLKMLYYYPKMPHRFRLQGGFASF